MPAIQFAQIPKDINGKEIPVDEKGEEKASLGRFCVMALDMTLPSDQDEPSSKAYARGKLAHDIMQAEKDISVKQLDLSVEQVAMLKDRVAKLRPASLAYTLSQMLDPQSG